MLARLIDAFVRLSLLVRGRVPGGLVAAAHRLAAAALAQAGEAPDRGGSVRTAYGRVLRTGGYTVLQYWYFYPFNDWRSTFYGVNDHEADWETISVYLVPDGDDGVAPAWVGASSHDLAGADLRRRWDDPQLRREGDHPVIYPGAGSHSGAFLPGDYVVSVELPALRRVVVWLQHVRRRLLPWTAEPGRGAFAIPFVDYARGDGAAIGAGHDHTWRLELIGDDTPWVRDYRGLWGLDTHDPFGGERAPAGPRYERRGRVRRSWTDPLGWVGLDGVPATPDEEEQHLRSRIVVINEELAGLEEEVVAQRATVRGLTAQVRSLGAAADSRALRRERVAERERGERELAALTARRSRLAEERAAHEAYLAGPREPARPDAHLRHPHMPYAADTDVRSRFLRVWAAVSTPVLVLGLGGSAGAADGPGARRVPDLPRGVRGGRGDRAAPGAGVRDGAGRAGAVDPRRRRADPGAAVELAPGAGRAARRPGTGAAGGERAGAAQRLTPTPGIRCARAVGGPLPGTASGPR